MSYVKGLCVCNGQGAGPVSIGELLILAECTHEDTGGRWRTADFNTTYQASKNIQSLMPLACFKELNAGP